MFFTLIFIGLDKYFFNFFFLFFFQRTPEQKKDQFKPDKEGGYDNLKYEITKVDLVEINSTPVNVIHVELECDLEKTPWCDIKKPPK